MADKEFISMKFKLLSEHLDERTFRLCLAAEAMSRGRGGITEVAKATGVSRTTLHAGIHELQSSSTESSPIRLPEKRVRKPGAGRKRFKESDKQLLEDLDLLVDPVTRGDPMSPL